MCQNFFLCASKASKSSTCGAPCPPISHEHSQKIQHFVSDNQLYIHLSVYSYFVHLQDRITRAEISDFFFTCRFRIRVLYSDSMQSRYCLALLASASFSISSCEPLNPSLLRQYLYFYTGKASTFDELVKRVASASRSCAGSSSFEASSCVSICTIVLVQQVN